MRQRRQRVAASSPAPHRTGGLRARAPLHSSGSCSGCRRRHGLLRSSINLLVVFCGAPNARRSQRFLMSFKHTEELRTICEQLKAASDSFRTSWNGFAQLRAATNNHEALCRALKTDENLQMISNKSRHCQTTSTSFGQITPAPNTFTSSNSFEQPRRVLKRFRQLRTSSTVLEEVRRASKSFEELRSVEQLPTASTDLGDFKSCGQLRAGCLGGLLDRDRTHSREIVQDAIRQDWTRSHDIERQQTTTSEELGYRMRSDEILPDRTKSQ